MRSMGGGVSHAAAARQGEAPLEWLLRLDGAPEVSLSPLVAPPIQAAWGPIGVVRTRAPQAPPGPSKPVCADNATWDGGHGGCEYYAFGEVMHTDCAEDGAAAPAACPKACGICRPIAEDLAFPTRLVCRDTDRPVQIVGR